MNTKHLKAKILDLAICGKLVPQDSSEGNAADLLQKIRDEKHAVVEALETTRQKKLKEDKNASFIIKADDGKHYEQFTDGSLKDIEDEIPFEIPENWCWCRLKDLCIKIGSGSTPLGSNYAESGVPFFRSQNVQNYGLVFKDIKYITDEIHRSMISTEVVSNDLLLNITGGSIGRCAVVPSDFLKGNVSQHVCILRVRQNLLLPNYLHRFILSPAFQTTYETTGSGRPGLPKYNLEKMLLPLPPLSEQKRIVSAIEKAFEQIDIIEKNKLNLKTYIKQTKSKVLDLAIHGKLVEQNPQEGNAFELLEKIRNEKAELIKQKKLKEDKKASFIIKADDGKHYEQFADGSLKDVENEIPFELLPNWTWARFKEITNDMLDGDWIESKDQAPEGIRLVQTGNVGNGIFRDKPGSYKFISQKTFDELNCSEIYAGDILISRLPEPVGKTCVIPESPYRMITAVDCTIVRLNYQAITQKYFSYYTQSPTYFDLVKEHCSGSTRLRISKDNLKTVLFPLPPLSEQKRIVAKIEQVFEQLDVLEKSMGE